MKQSIKEREELEFYRKEFPYYWIRNRSRLNGLQLCLSLCPAIVIMGIPIKSKLKPVISGLFDVWVWKHMKRQLPGRIQTAYEQYIEQVLKKKHYERIFAPEVKMEKISDGDNVISIAKIRGAGYDLIEFTSEAVCIEKQPVYEKSSHAFVLYKKKGTGKNENTN